MIRRERAGARVLAGIVGALVGATVVLGAGGLAERGATRPASIGPPETHAPPPPARIPEPRRPGFLLVWASGGLPAGAENVLRSVEGIRRVTTIAVRHEWIHTVRAGGQVLTRTKPGFAIPWDVAYVDPKEYASFVPPGDRDLILALRPGIGVIARTEAELRGAAEGLTIGLRDAGPVRIIGSISDVATNGYEAVIAGPPPPRSAAVYGFALVHGSRTLDRRTIERRLLPLLEPEQSLRVRAEGETPFLRYGDAVLPEMLIKKTFGEFSARDLGQGQLEIDPAWRGRNIVSARVPILGTVTCHRAILPQLRRALESVADAGLRTTIDTGQYGGCFGPRFINRNPLGRLSHHAWGIAFDVNVAGNAFGRTPTLDPRLVKVFEDWGFTWGGRWLVPDGMHFEWTRWP